MQIAPSPPGDESDALVDRVPSNEDLETATVQRDAIDRALATLPEELRLLVTLRDVQGLDTTRLRRLSDCPLVQWNREYFERANACVRCSNPSSADHRRQGS